MNPRIDVHHHALPAEYVDALKEVGVTGDAGVPFPKWSLGNCIKDMDRLGITTAMLSISTPGVYFKDHQFSQRLARTMNDYLAQLVEKHPQRLGALASLPLPDVQGALEELRYAYDELNVDGVVLLSNIQGSYLGDARFEDIYKELNKRRAVVFIHPTNPPYIEKTEFAIGIADWPFETTRAVANLMHSGVFDRYPNIRYILSHGGGTVPYLAWRLAILSYRQRDKTRTIKALYDFAVAKEGPRDGLKQLKKLYYDTAAVSYPASLRALQELVPPSNILLGTDLGWAPRMVADLFIKGLNEYEGFTSEDLRGVMGENALSLFQRLSLELQ